MEYPNDKMTGLPGGAALNEELHQRLEQRQQFAVAVVDVDGLANLNYDLNHLEGDKMLVQLAELLTQANVGAVYRTGGDKFTLVMPQVTREQAVLAAEKLQTSVANYDFALSDRRAVTVTVGVAHSPFHADEAQVLLDIAAGALSHAKHEAYLLRQASRPS